MPRSLFLLSHINRLKFKSFFSVRTSFRLAFSFATPSWYCKSVYALVSLLSSVLTCRIKPDFEGPSSRFDIGWWPNGFPVQFYVRIPSYIVISYPVDGPGHSIYVVVYVNIGFLAHVIVILTAHSASGVDDITHHAHPRATSLWIFLQERTSQLAAIQQLAFADLIGCR